MPSTAHRLRSRFHHYRLALAQWLGEWWDNHGMTVAILGFVVLFVLIYFGNRVFITIGAGQAGVLFRRFAGGTQVNRVYGEGLHIIGPWDVMTIYDMRVQQTEHSFSAITSNGLTINITVSIRYQPKLLNLALLHKTVGPHYVEKIIKPEVQAEVRDLVGQYSAEEIYTTKRSLIQRMLEDTLGQISEKFLLLDSLLIKTITLPPTIQSAIEAKLAQEQASLEMKFRLTREEQEADRKVIEADGVRAAQEMIAETLSDQLLQYKAIEALLELAKSDNSKVVVLGGQAGLPFMVDTSAADSLPKHSGAANTNGLLKSGSVLLKPK